MGIFKVLDGRSGGGLELDNGLSIIVRLGIDDDLEFQAFALHYALECLEIDPQVVGVEDLEFADFREIFFLRNRLKIF